MRESPNLGGSLIMATDRDTILNRIKACFNLASTSANTTEAEMAAALAAAKRLMAEHNVSEADVMATQDSVTSGPVIEEVTVTTRLHPHQYEQQLAMVCGDLFSVRPIMIGKVIKMFGTATDVAIAAEVFKILRDEINKMAMECPFTGTERDHWRVGVTHTLRMRAKKSDSGISKQDEVKCTALAVVKSTAIEEYVRERCGETRERTGRVRVNEAYVVGRRDGKSVSLDFSKKLR